MQIARSKAKRDLENKKSSFRINKKPIPDRNIIRFIDRKNISKDELLDMGSPDNGKLRASSMKIHRLTNLFTALSPAFSVFTPDGISSLTPAADSPGYSARHLSPGLEFNMLSITDPAPAKSLTPPHTTSNDNELVVGLKAVDSKSPPSKYQAMTDDELWQPFTLPQIHSSAKISEDEDRLITDRAQAIPICDTDHASRTTEPAQVSSHAMTPSTRGTESNLSDQQLAFPPTSKAAYISVAEEMKQYLDARKLMIASESILSGKPDEPEPRTPTRQGLEEPTKAVLLRSGKEATKKLLSPDLKEGLQTFRYREPIPGLGSAICVKIWTCVRTPQPTLTVPNF